ncbi:MAG: lipid-transfer protein [Deltaproteobacteria bacterium]|jgi:acetyl-CoA acetyltransferase|nr:lipid-transfer protein [Deltaproteobacteria bacterium]
MHRASDESGWSLRDRFAIVGIGETRYTRAGRASRPEFTLACEAVSKALDDAGLRTGDVDGLCSYSYEHSDPLTLAQALGLEHLSFAALYPGGGNAATGIVHHALAGLEAGEADVVVCYRSICQGQFGRYGQSLQDPIEQAQSGWRNFASPFGLFTAAQMYALAARRHMALYGTTSEQFGHVAVASYDNAQRNPRAVMYGKPITLADHQASRMISDPYRLFDCCQESDGAAAIVVTRVERARSCPHQVVSIAGAAHAMERLHGLDNRPAQLWAEGGLAASAAELYRRAGISAEEIDVAQLYDAFTGNVIMHLEDFGFCARGEGGPFVESGAIDWPRGSLPVNTAGGNLAEAYIHGFSHVLEAVRQMRGTSTSQVAGAEHGLVVSAIGAYSGGLILRRLH